MIKNFGADAESHSRAIANKILEADDEEGKKV
jgi:hypothetical protein